MSKRNIVGHCYRPAVNNDKVYMCCIRHTGTEWVVLAKWGRRGKRLNNQDKGRFTTEAAAVQAQVNLWKDRAKEGYQDIESAAYETAMKNNGVTPLTLNSQGIIENLELEDGQGQAAPNIPVIEWDCERCGKKFQPELNDDGNPIGKDAFCPACIKKIKDLAAKRAKDGEDDVLVCVDNAGMEDRFDVGIEYIVMEHKDPAMVFVYDKMGRKDEYFRNRFITKEQWDRKQGKFTVNFQKSRDSQAGSQIQFAPMKPGDTIRIIPPTSATMPTRFFSEEEKRKETAKLEAMIDKVFA